MLVSQRSYYPHVRPPHALYPYVRPSHTPTFHHIPSDVPRFTVISHEGMHHREQPWDDLHELGIVGVCHLHEISEGGQLKPYLTLSLPKRCKNAHTANSCQNHAKFSFKWISVSATGCTNCVGSTVSSGTLMGSFMGSCRHF